MASIELVRYPEPAILKLGAFAATLAVVGVVCGQLFLQPAVLGPGIEATIRSYATATTRAQALVILLQVMAMFVALLIVAYRTFPRAPGLTLLAISMLVFWQVLEIVPRSIDYFTFALFYAEAYGTTADPALIEQEFVRFFHWAAGLRSMRQIVWAAGLILLGLALWHHRKIGRIASMLMILNGLRVAALLLFAIAGTALPFGTPLFVIINVALFASLAWWLWQEARHASSFGLSLTAADGALNEEHRTS